MNRPCSCHDKLSIRPNDAAYSFHPYLHADSEASSVIAFVVTAWQKVYGNIYSSVTQAFREPNYIESLLPSPTLTFATLVTIGALPGGPGVTPQVARSDLPARVRRQLANQREQFTGGGGKEK